MKLIDELKNLNQMRKDAKEQTEYIGFCSKCVAPVEIEETDAYIRCTKCGHTKDKSKMKLLTGEKVVKKLKKMGRI